MDGPYVDDFRTLTAVETRKIDKQMTREFQSVVAEAARRGVLYSSMSIEMVHRAATQTLPVRAQMAFSILMRSLEAYGIPVTAANKNAVEALLSAWIDDQRAKVEATMMQTVPFKQNLQGNWDGPLLGELKEISNAECQRLSGEISLISARNERIAQKNAESGGASIVFNGPVGLVQTGAGSYGVALQHIDGATKASLNEALDKLLRELDEKNGEFEFDVDEVRTVAVEAKAEVAKDAPSALRLRGLISAIGGAISYAPKLKSAYDTLKWAGNLIGINMP